MDGIMALKQLRANPQTKSIPVIAVTASAMTYKQETVLPEGFDGYQTKPCQFERFSRRNRKSARRSRKLKM
jgi:CheY-like chemotaxis protein